ncbi:unnamed protein product [Ambrosiozyma monospora]|uniref:Unnamed protein product n=1 Tax=Ambrosiozyma monospora TaxID=43982 RepID=A0A9W7DIQ4_AMBMO|nr:unnamed protein product [Ambrosiozyma monospora]
MKRHFNRTPQKQDFKSATFPLSSTPTSSQPTRCRLLSHLPSTPTTTTTTTSTSTSTPTIHTPTQTHQQRIQNESMNKLKHSEYTEYQILFTTQPNKKQPRWEDGMMRHFKFNNKLIIYNIPDIITKPKFSQLQSTQFVNHYNRFKIGQVLKFKQLAVMIDEFNGVFERDVSVEFAKIPQAKVDVPTSQRKSNVSSTSFDDTTRTTTSFNSNSSNVSISDDSRLDSSALNVRQIFTPTKEPIDIDHVPYVVSLKKQRRKVVGLPRPKKHRSKAAGAISGGRISKPGA